ncbi:hypothetical protein GCM10018771_31370 [Streptomyces cellulosae]|nr:hypothetical protein GCM10018771_31370 [Streptomyces cellulosae]
MSAAGPPVGPAAATLSYRAGEQVPLAPTELRLLLEFAEHPGIVPDRQTLLRNVWDYGWDGDSRVVDLCVQRRNRAPRRHRRTSVPWRPPTATTSTR